jgi:hypothetical protein
MIAPTESTELHGENAAWPLEAGMVMTALEAGSWNDERREHARAAFRVKALLWLFADSPGGPARVLYTRDANHRGIGFVTRERLPLGYGGIVRMQAPTSNKTLAIPCTLYRCRVAAPGWYEGALHFNRDQMEFFVDNEPNHPANP